MGEDAGARGGNAVLPTLSEAVVGAVSRKRGKTMVPGPGLGDALYGRAPAHGCAAPGLLLEEWGTGARIDAGVDELAGAGVLVAGEGRWRLVGYRDAVATLHVGPGWTNMAAVTRLEDGDAVPGASALALMTGDRWIPDDELAALEGDPAASSAEDCRERILDALVAEGTPWLRTTASLDLSPEAASSVSMGGRRERGDATWRVASLAASLVVSRRERTCSSAVARRLASSWEEDWVRRRVGVSDDGASGRSSVLGTLHARNARTRTGRWLVRHAAPDLLDAVGFAWGEDPRASALRPEATGRMQEG